MIKFVVKVAVVATVTYATTRCLMELERRAKAKFHGEDD